MTELVVDTSALIAVLNAEPEMDRISEVLDRSTHVAISAATLHEAFCVSMREKIVQGPQRLELLLGLVLPEVVPFDDRQLAGARAAYARYGRGAGDRPCLNMGDCFSYALAKSRNLPLLFKGDDFIHTDVEPALKPV